MTRLYGCADEARKRMEAFDQLPQSIRDFLNGSSSDFSSLKILEHYRMFGEAKTLAGLRVGEARNVAKYRDSLEAAP